MKWRCLGMAVGATACAAAWIFGWATAGWSATLLVPAQFGTIQAGIDAASSGDTVLVAPGVYTDYETRNLDGGLPETSCAFLKDGVLVRSEFGPLATTIDIIELIGIQPSAITAEALPSTTTAIEGFTVEGRDSGLGAYVRQCGNVTLDNCVFQNFDGGPTSGGAGLTEGNVVFSHCDFINCRANVGGAVRATDGDIHFLSCEIRNCSNVGIYVDQPADVLTTVNVNGCQFIDNSSMGGAGGLVVARVLGQTTIHGCLFKGNVNTGSGGGGLGMGLGPKTVEYCVFLENGAMGSNGQGGGLAAGGSDNSFVIRNNSFVGNYKTPNSTPGSAVQLRDRSTFVNNIVVSSLGGPALDDREASTFVCNVYWENLEGNGVPLSLTDREIDPLFCDVAIYDLTLRAGSPCLPDDPLGCGLVGALGQGCGPIAVESKSWGAIKALYR